jgi:hypothetical protein
MHAILVHEGGAEATWDRVGEVPEVMKIRPLSLQAFDARHCAGSVIPHGR